MSCKSCGASKVIRGDCAYCRNPSDTSGQRYIYYLDVGDMSAEESSALIKLYTQHLDQKSDFGSAMILQDIVWPLLQTPTHGRMMTA